MQISRVPHSWNLSPRRAAEVQRTLAPRVRTRPTRRRLRFVVGVDCAFAEQRGQAPAALGSDCLAAAVVWDAQEGCVVEERVASRPLRFPYVPGLLSFRELPAVLAALRRVRSEVDAIFVDGHGFAHPRRFGIACHLGVLADRPCVGVAKSRLVGSHREPGRARGDRTPLLDEGERLGTVLRSRDDTRPLFVSVGHAIDLATAESLVLQCGVGYRLPEPTRRADRLVALEKRARRERR
ncbi:MAG: endonuclease V [Myxococcota bacterium]